MKADVDQNNGGLNSGVADRLGRTRSAVGASIMRSRLFIKYTVLFVAVVVLALVANGAFEVWFSYQEHKASLIDLQEQQAVAAAVDAALPRPIRTAAASSVPTMAARPGLS